jgi:DNA-binding MurR/RpiR family transcriptional regulator
VSAIYGTVRNAIVSNYEILSHTQQRIAEKVVEQVEKYLMLPISKCAQELQVSEASLTRFSRAIGYASYAQLREDCCQEVVEALGIRERLEHSIQKSGEHSNFLAHQLHQELEHFQSQVESVDYTTLEQLSQKIAQAGCVYLAGLGVSTSLVRFLEFRLRRMGVQVRALCTGGYEMMEDLTGLQNKDLLLVIGFRRIYRELLTAAAFAKSMGCPVFAISEHPLSALALASDWHLVLKRGPDSELNSLAFPMAICNALALSVARQREAEIQQTITNLDWLNAKYSELEG